MANKKRVISLRIEEEWVQDLQALAGTFDVSPEEVIRQALPDPGVVRLFFQCKSYLTDLRWDEIAEVGREAIRVQLRAQYREGLKQHLARLGLTTEASADDVEAAKQQAIEEMRADASRPVEHQLRQAEVDSVYLGYLYEAWKRAAAGESGYALAQVPSPGPRRRDSDDPDIIWAVLKDDRIV